MTQVNRDVLREFLLPYCDGEAVAIHMKRLEPLFQYAISGRYWFSKPEELDEGWVARAISGAINKTVDRIIFVSVDKLAFKPNRKPYMSDEGYEAYCKCRSAGLAMSLGEPLRPSLRISIGFGLSRLLSEKHLTDMKNCLDKSIISGLTASFSHELKEIVGSDILYSLRGSVVESLRFYIGSIVAGDQKYLGVLTPLIELLPQAIPLGFKKDESETYLVLTA